MIKQLILAIFWASAFIACSSDDNNGSEQSGSVDAPSNITVERLGETNVLLRWTDNSNNETGFKILQRKADTSENKEIGEVAANVTEYTIDQGLEEGNIYYFGVQSFSKTNSSRAIYVLYRMEVLGDIPNISIIGNVTANSVCISASYQVTNIAGHSNVKYGLCWSADGAPTINSQIQYGPELPTDGSAVLQVISNALLDYGKFYKIRAFLTTSTGTYYSTESTVALGNEYQSVQLTWNKLAKSTLPSEIELYETVSSLNGKKFHAWYAIGDLSTGNVEVQVNVPSSIATIDAQLASFNGDCYLLVNGGYFYNSSHTGLAIINSVKTGSISPVRGSLKTADEEYNILYYITRGIFGVSTSGKPDVYWGGTDDSGNPFYFDRPLPSVKGEAKYGVISNTNPTAAISWNPKHALSAGPVLLKEGKITFDFTETTNGADFYLSNYEIIPYDIFGPSISPDRTAIGHRQDGKVVIFICDGRITASEGATLTELAQIMKGLGCVGAINLDGGGSTGMVVGSEHLNDMTGGNRAVVSTIGFFKKK
ncbi:hypothetical protein EZS27_000881 [termite gut metagenome]|uniref:Fibronectin type-III domain-containing protein n=1 Tax=termite gut metagenome TaxID=433724 RepID=A0A5J4SZS5_9ZZZZ